MAMVKSFTATVKDVVRLAEKSKKRYKTRRRVVKLRHVKKWSTVISIRKQTDVISCPVSMIEGGPANCKKLKVFEFMITSVYRPLFGDLVTDELVEVWTGCSEISTDIWIVSPLGHFVKLLGMNMRSSALIQPMFQYSTSINSSNK